MLGLLFTCPQSSGLRFSQSSAALTIVRLSKRNLSMARCLSPCLCSPPPPRPCLAPTQRLELMQKRADSSKLSPQDMLRRNQDLANQVRNKASHKSPHHCDSLCMHAWLPRGWVRLCSMILAECLVFSDQVDAGGPRDDEAVPLLQDGELG